MWLPNISLKTWFTRYPLLKNSYPKTCTCGEIRNEAVPFVSGDWVGLKYSRCKCGKLGSRVSILKTREQRDEFRKMLDKI